MTWAVVSHPVSLPDVTLSWTPTGSPAESASLTGLAGLGWAVSGAVSGSMQPAAAIGSVLRALESAIFAAMDVEGDVLAATGLYDLPPHRTAWRIVVESAIPLDAISLSFGTAANARRWGHSAGTMIGQNVGGNTWILASDGYNIEGAWSGGCSRVAQDEPDTRHRVSVSSSPYTVGESTHVLLGAREYRTVRWVYVDAAFVHALQAGEADFAEQAGRQTNDDNNLLDALVARIAAGDLLRLTVEGREGVPVRVMDGDPAVSTYASRAGQSGRRYDVEIEFEASV